MWTDNYIGIPFMRDGRTRNGLDCWGLTCLVYKEQYGIALPTFSGVYTSGDKAKLCEIAEMMERESEKWTKVSIPQTFDVVRLRISGPLAFHVGLVAGRDFLHIMDGIQSIVEPLKSLLWKDRIVGYYRHEALL